MSMLTTSEVADRLGVTVQRVHQFIRDERLPAKKMGRDYLIDEDDLKRVEIRQTGRPPKQTTAPENRATGQKRASGAAASKKKGVKK